jgi:SAM-dependent methyltransferase
MSNDHFDVSIAWQKELQSGGYEHRCQSPREFCKLKKLGWVWKRILRATGVRAPARVFELGSGGGIHLASLALNGYETHGIDVSAEVTERAINFLREVNAYQPITASVETASIFDEESRQEIYDMCFHFGVVEHFLDNSDRAEIWRRLIRLTKSGGWIVSVVPCGRHFMRTMVREQGLAGYRIPEIDYSCESHIRELQQAGLVSVRGLPHNYFAFLSAHPSRFVSKLLFPFAYLFGNILMPISPIPNSVREILAHSLIVLGRKP